MEQNKASKVFISHGHNEVLKLKLKNFIIERVGLQPIVLAEQPDLGLTVIEKLEKYGKDCCFALILLTGDDRTIGGGIRARQNVIHELGFFHGHIGRNKVLLLKQTGVELFSNISGLIYKEFVGDKIETIFEDIRLAIETGSALSSGKSVTSQQNLDIKKEFDMEKILENLSHTPKLACRELSKELKKIIAGLPIEMQLKRIKCFLNDKKKIWEKRLKEIQEETKKSKEKFAEDPEHGGKMAAMTIQIFTEIEPKSQIDLIEKLLSEINFDESNNIENQIVIDRIFKLINEQVE